MQHRTDSGRTMHTWPLSVHNMMNSCADAKAHPLHDCSPWERRHQAQTLWLDRGSPLGRWYQLSRPRPQHICSVANVMLVAPQRHQLAIRPMSSALMHTANAHPRSTLRVCACHVRHIAHASDLRSALMAAPSRVAYPSILMLAFKTPLGPRNCVKEIHHTSQA